MEVTVQQLKAKVLGGGHISRDEALEIYKMPLNELTEAADEIRRQIHGDSFDLCTIINGKNGSCSENCKFCAQSAHYKTELDSYTLLDTEEIVEAAKYNAERGVLRFSIVTSGRALSDSEVDQMCEAIRAIREAADISVCASFGLLNTEQYSRLREAGLSRVHNNLETSERFFESVCTTHTFQDKVEAIKAAQKAGLHVCSGGIMGLGETVEDRIDMALTLRGLGVYSVPVNMLNPIPGTPFSDRDPLTVDDMRRIVAVYRFILPQAAIRLAGGRGLLPESGKECFISGANAVISGDMLTTAGYTIESDMKMLHELGYELRLIAEGSELI